MGTLTGIPSPEHLALFKDGIFIGREPELEVLHSSLRLMHTGGNCSVSIAGNSGVGKSALIDHFLEQIDLRTVTLTRSNGKSLKATRPFEMMRNFFDVTHEQLTNSPELHAHLSEVLTPETLWILGAISPACRELFDIPERYDTSAIEAFGVNKCLKALTNYISHIARVERPLIMIFEDCQWADEFSILFLKHFLKDSGSKGVKYTLIIPSFRIEDTSNYRELNSLQVQSKLLLQPFTLDEGTSFIEKITDDLPDEAMQFIIQASNGNPFLMQSAVMGIIEANHLSQDEELELTTIIDQSMDPYAFVKRRFLYLPQDTLGFLQWAAVAGKEFDVRLHPSASEDESKLQSYITDGLRRCFFEQIDDHHYTFIHDKIRESLLDELSLDQQQQYHYEIAQVLITSHDHELFDIAYHLSEAGETQQAFQYAIQAAEESRKCFALHVAEQQYRIAEQGLSAEITDAHYTVYLGLGEVLMLSGKYDDSEQYHLKALKLTTDALSRARIERNIGELLFKMGRNLEAAEALCRALKLLGEPVPTSLIGYLLAITRRLSRQVFNTALPQFFLQTKQRPPNEHEKLITQIYNRLAIVYWFNNGLIPTLWSHFSALNTIERFTDSHELAHTYASHGPAISLIGWKSRALSYGYRTMAVMSRLPENKLILGQCLHFNGVALYCHSEYRKCMEYCLHAVQTLEDVGDYWEMNIASSNVALSLYRLGSLKKAIEYSESEYVRTKEMGDTQSATVFMQVIALASEGNCDIRPIEELLEISGNDAQTHLEATCAKACILLQKEKYQEAVVILAEARRHLYRTLAIQEYSCPVLPWYATALRLTIQNDHTFSDQEKSRLTKTWKRIVNEVLWVSLLRTNSRPHALREAALYSAHHKQRHKAISYIEQSLTICRNEMLLYEESLSLLAYADICSALELEDIDTYRIEGEEKRRRCISQENIIK